jgi:hypothetical protein
VGEGYRSLSSSSCIFLHSPLTPSALHCYIREIFPQLHNSEDARRHLHSLFGISPVSLFSRLHNSDDARRHLHSLFGISPVSMFKIKMNNATCRQQDFFHNVRGKNRESHVLREIGRPSCLNIRAWHCQLPGCSGHLQPRAGKAAVPKTWCY